jgi:hypothetical protein
MEAASAVGAEEEGARFAAGDLLPIICWRAGADGRPIALNRRWHEYVWTDA